MSEQKPTSLSAFKAELKSELLKELETRLKKLESELKSLQSGLSELKGLSTTSPKVSPHKHDDLYLKLGDWNSSMGNLKTWMAAVDKSIADIDKVIADLEKEKERRSKSFWQ